MIHTSMKTIGVLLLGACLLAGCSKWNVEPKQITSGSTDSKPIFSKGQIAVPILKGYDLDAGKVVADGSIPADFYWNVEKISSTTRGELYAHNGSKFAIASTLDKAVLENPSSTLYAALMQQAYSDNSIATDARAPIRLGTVIAYQTNEGRYGVFRVDKLGSDYVLTITWVTYGK
jgi:hypothetical protein